MADFYVKIDGFAGRGTGSHTGWLTTRAVLLDQMRDKTLVMTRDPDNLSHKLWLARDRGRGIGKVIIEAVKNGERFIRIELTDVMIPSITHQTDRTRGPDAFEVIVLAYADVKVAFQSAEATRAGAVAARWLAP